MNNLHSIHSAKEVTEKAKVINRFFQNQSIFDNINNWNQYNYFLKLEYNRFIITYLQK